MANEVRDFNSAVEALKSVAQALHTPLDTSELERAARALARAKGGDDDKKDDDVKVEAPKVEPKAPVGVPRDSVK